MVQDPPSVQPCEGEWSDGSGRQHGLFMPFVSCAFYTLSSVETRSNSATYTVTHSHFPFSSRHFVAPTEADLYWSLSSCGFWAKLLLPSPSSVVSVNPNSITLQYLHPVTNFLPLAPIHSRCTKAPGKRNLQPKPGE